ncbi:MAG: sigma-70 family RNA polymerase sigma factor [Phycisphaerales bacterium]|nr:sigma-70 family RNA polymerase sigma factor [Phycisphaerales bacterium]MCB9857702.1 sigma-70 family RNA polymerase sigma factor [Phycisphaerales bacterium]MCB9864791.1 sigma-70 family RNA polymerase sigma factor [Phycisphaerales bacterium]
MDTTLSDEQLLQRARHGDKSALGDLLLRHGPHVRERLQINSRWRAVLEPNDIMQVTYFEAFEQISRFTGTATSFPRWLKRIADNNLRDAIQFLDRAKRPPPDRRVVSSETGDGVAMLYELIEEGGVSPSRQAGMHEIRQVLEDEIDRLPDDYQRVIRRLFLEGKSVSDVAEEMGRTSGAIHLLRIRAVKRLGEMLGSGSRFFSHH